MVTGIDIGFGYTKTFSGSGSKIFPTSVTDDVAHLIDSAFTDIPPLITVNNVNYIVGEEVIRAGQPVSTRNRNFIGSPHWLAILGYALYINNIFDNETTLVIGLPPGYFSKETTANIKHLIATTTITCESYTWKIQPQNIEIIPQGGGIFFSWVSPRDNLLKSVVIADIGF